MLLDKIFSEGFAFFAGLVVVLGFFFGLIFFLVNVDAENAEACIKSGKQWIENNCVDLSRD